MLLTRFLQDRRASAVTFFGLALIPIVGVVGASVDYSRGNSVKADLQASLDAASLMVAKNAPTMTAAQVQAAATNYFNASFNRPEAKNVQVTAAYTVQGGNYKINMTGSATVKTDFMGMFGVSQMNINATAQAIWGIKKLQLALVLDNTGSMASDNKLTALKTAAHQLLTTLQNAVYNPGDIKVAIIPFATDVNIGTSYVNDWWIDWTSWNASNKTCTGTKPNRVCVPKSHSVWNGCVTDRNQNYDTQSTTPINGSPATYFVAHQASNCPTAIMPLSTDWTALNNKIDAMIATGNTNQTIGLAWGFQALTTGVPLNAPAIDDETQRVIVLFTDGLNTQNRWTSSEASIDARTQLACDNIKAAKIQIYTVLVMQGDSQLLQSCASDPGKYFAMTQSGQIVSTFNQIGIALTQLRIAQ